MQFEQGYGGREDCSADVMLGWDADTFYLAATVTDNALHQDQVGYQLWQGDCIQLAFRNGPPNSETGYDGTEHEVGLTLGPEGPQAHATITATSAARRWARGGTVSRQSMRRKLAQGFRPRLRLIG